MAEKSNYEVEVALGYDSASQARAAAQAERGIKDILRRLQQASSTDSTGNVVSPAAITKLERDLASAVRRAFQQDISNSPAFKQISRYTPRGAPAGFQNDQQLVRNASPVNNNQSQLLASQLRLAQAELAREKVISRAGLKIGAEPRELTLPSSQQTFTAGGYADEATRTQARLSAEERLVRATKAAADARDKFIADIVGSERKEQEALGKEILAIERNTASVAVATQKREHATAAEITAIIRNTNSANAAQRREEEATARGITALIRRAAVDEKAAEQEAERQRKADQATEARATPVSFPGADTGTRVGRAQENVNIAERNVAAARYRQAEVALKEAAGGEAVLRSENALSAANRNLDIARSRLADESVRAGQQQRAQQLGGTLGGQFALGFKGVTDRPFAEQIGQAFKFSAFYGTAYKILFAITQTFSQTLQEGIAFQQAVTELKLATGQTAESANKLADEVGKDAAQYGFDPAQGVQIAARAQGIYGTANSKDTGLQDQVARVSSRVVNQIAFASGQQPADIQGNIAAVSQAYGLGFQSQQFIGDLDSYFSHIFGTAPGETIQATSQAATVGRAAGFSPAEVSAIAADIIARTGSSPDAAGGYLAQIFSRSGEGSLNTLLGRYGISQTATLSDQFKELAKVYAAQPDQRDDISAAFGRGKVQNAVIALLQDYPEVQKAVAGSGDATGALDKATELRLNDIGGQIQSLTGSLRLFAKEFGESGLLDAVGAGVIAFKEIVDAATGLLQVFNELPRGVRDAILAIAALAAASRLAAAAEGEQAAATGIAGLTGRARNGLATFATRSGLAERAGVFSSAGILTQGAESGLITRGGIVPVGERAVNVAGRGAVPLASARGAIAAGASTVGSAGVFAAVIGDAILFQKTRETSQQFNDARQAYAEFLNSDITGATSAEQLRSRASQAQEVANASKDAASGILPSIQNLGANKRQALSDEAEAKRQVDIANAAAKYLENKSANVSNTSLISGFDSDAITSSLDAITTAGGTAKTQFQALANAVQLSGRAAQVAAANYDPKAIAANNYSGLSDAIVKGGFGIDLTSQPNALGSFLNNTVGVPQRVLGGKKPIATENLSPAILANALKGVDLNKRLSSALSGNGLTSLNDLSDPDTLNSVVADIVDGLPQQVIDNSGGKLGFGDTATIQNTLAASVQEYIEGLRDQGTTTGRAIQLTSDQLLALTNATLEAGQSALSALPTSDLTGRVRQAQATLRRIRSDINSTAGGGSPQDLANLQAAQNDVATARYNQLDAVMKTLQARNGPANSNAAIAADAAIAKRIARQQIRSAVKNGSGDVLAQVISSADASALGYARQAIESARQAALLQAEYDAKAKALAGYLAGNGLTKVPTGASGVDAETRKAINKQFNNLLGVVDSTPNAEDPTAVTDTAAQVNAARAAAAAAKDGGGIAAASAAITQAKADMAEAKKGSVAFYTAQAALFNAQRDYANAVIAYNQNLYLLNHDATDPLVQARAAVRAARAKLASDIASGGGKDVIAEDRVNVQSAQASAESTAFNQRLQAVQTADELGRISHSKYLNYLQHEHDRLVAIKDRTYQQQQELDQVDGLIKAANSEMLGQFNFGDIKLPTPYEVRRRIAEEAEAIKNPTGNASNAIQTGTPVADPTTQAGNTTINIDGADVAKVRSILTDILGKRATTTTTSPRHR